MHTTQKTNQSYTRLIALYGAVGLMLIVFGLRLWQMQVSEAEYYRTLADRNRFRMISVDAPRGIIYDRNGMVLARNVPAYDVTIVPAYLPDDEDAMLEIYHRLGQLLHLPVSSATASLAGVGSPGIKDIVDQGFRIAPYRPVTIQSGVPRDVALQIMEESPSLPGVNTVIASGREYVLGLLTSHVVGYTGRVSEETLVKVSESLAEALAHIGPATLNEFLNALKEAKNYNPDTDRVGMTGVELAYEDWLHGVKGERYVEEDVAGREIRVVGKAVDPVPGHNVYLTLDRDLQQVALEALQQQIDLINTYAGSMRTRIGVVIALDPRNGHVLAMVSTPTFDNNLFTGGISASEFDTLLTDPFLPLVNHAISDQVQPGSTFKIIPAAAALQEGVITPRTTWYDTGSIVIPNRYFPNDPRQAATFYSWLRTGHGETNVVKALADSVNTFFYVTGGGLDIPDRPKYEGLGPTRLISYTKAFGIGQLTGVDLPGEAPGHVPDGQWKRLTYGENWSLGDTYIMAIGEGYVVATPLQIANMYAAIANGGTLYRPELMLRITDADGNAVQSSTPQVLGTLPISQENLATVREGLEAAVTWGTATQAQVAGLPIAGKTGTAEFCDGLALQLGYCANGLAKPTHAWFAAYAPADNPQIALLVYIYNGGEGSQAAVPVAQKVLQFWYDRQNGIQAGAGAP